MPKENKTKKYHVVNNMNRGLKIRLAVSPSRIEREVEIVEQVGGVNRGNAEKFPIGREGNGHSSNADNSLSPDIILRAKFRKAIFNSNQNMDNFFSISNILKNTNNSTGVGQPVKVSNSAQMSPAVTASALPLSTDNRPITSNFSPKNSYPPSVNTVQQNQNPSTSLPLSSSFSPETDLLVRELLSCQIPVTITQASQFPPAPSILTNSAPSTFPTPSQSQVLHPHLQNVFKEMRGLHYIVHNYNNLSTSFFLLQQRYQDLLRENIILCSQISGCTCKSRK